jgi:hypothetical protein
MKWGERRDQRPPPCRDGPVVQAASRDPSVHIPREAGKPNGRLDSIYAQVNRPPAVTPSPAPPVKWCLSPIPSPHTGRPTPCRKCERCLWIAQRRWMRRAEREFRQSGRTWWVTLTHDDARAPRDLDGNPVAPTYREVKAWLRKVRKLDPSIRYLVREESGERFGRLHWHVLLHCSPVLQRRPMELLWKFGHFHARLAKSAGLAAYMAKYQAKHSAGKLRPSIGYGKRNEPAVTPNCPVDHGRKYRRSRKHAARLRLSAQVCRVRSEIDAQNIGLPETDQLQIRSDPCRDNPKDLEPRALPELLQRALACPNGKHDTVTTLTSKQLYFKLALPAAKRVRLSDGRLAATPQPPKREGAIYSQGSRPLVLDPACPASNCARLERWHALWRRITV